MPTFSNPHFDDHEQVVFFHDKASGLKAIVAVHNTKLGPGCGGCRMWPYDNDEEALTDVLRLSKGMTYKSAVAGLPLGGGKAVIIGDPKKDKSPALFKAFGRFLNNLGGSYIVAEDVGITPDDIELIHSETEFVSGTKDSSGDPSPHTALGTFLGIKVAAKHQFGSEDLTGKIVAVQGVGHVGYYLCKHLHESGAKLIVTDIDEQALQRVEQEFSATIVATEDIYHQDCDIYAPCALGATLNEFTIPMLKAEIVAGCANNQLATAEDGLRLQERGILYTPDYVINAGGIINVALEVGDKDNYDETAISAKVEAIYTTLDTLFERAKTSGKTPAEVADIMARELIK
ncbi:Glu/Leu/Phe/Val dehydrogenase [Catenovulum sp. SM1970]|uniref:Glu/Leu/Phe/Val dehydrogenase n=1 Tax=Marinifaba aquimaris TaxID=2741323 RepID=UPI001571AD11|nr:Glu/Leu/Phe/Val dehydrogenase [Marinifaba aquimaris]